MGIFADYEFLTATKLNTVFGNYALSADVSGMVSAAVATETTARTTAVSGEATARTSAIATAAAAIVNNTSAPSIAFAPQGNPASTLGSHVLQATTGSSTGREFLLSANLYSNTGSGAGPGVADKVAIYAATEGVANSGDIWSVNSLTSMDAGFPSSSYALGYELDFNNFAQDRGTTIGWQGFSGATATGLLVTGASTHWSTSAISVEGNNSTQWQRGVSVINAGQAAFFDWCNATAGLISYGNHTYGVDLNPMTLGFGGAAVRIANGHPISSRNAANTADVPLIYLNGSNNITLGGAGSSGIYVSVPNLVPATDGTDRKSVV